MPERKMKFTAEKHPKEKERKRNTDKNSPVSRNTPAKIIPHYLRPC